MSTQNRNPMTTGLKMAVLLAALLVVFGGFLYLLAGPGAASVASQAVTIDDPDLDHIETEVSFNGSETAYVVVEDINDNEVDNQTISGTAGETITVESYVNDSGDYSVIVSEQNETTTDGIQVNETSVQVVSYSLLTEETRNITDPDNETIVVDVEFTGDATAEIEVTNDDTNSTVETLTLSGTDGDVLTREVNVSSAANYTTTVTTLDNTSAFDDVFVSVEGSTTTSGGVLGIDGDSGTSTVLVGAALLLLVVIGYRYGSEY